MKIDSRWTKAHRIRVVQHENTWEDHWWMGSDRNTPNSVSSIYRLKKKVRRTRSVSDRKRSGRPRSERTEKSMVLVENEVEEDDTQYVREKSRKIKMIKSSVQHCLSDLGLDSFQFERKQKLTGDDCENRLKFCERFTRFKNKTNNEYLVLFWWMLSWVQSSNKLEEHSIQSKKQPAHHRNMEIQRKWRSVSLWAEICDVCVMCRQESGVWIMRRPENVGKIHRQTRAAFPQDEHEESHLHARGAPIHSHCKEGYFVPWIKVQEVPLAEVSMTRMTPAFLRHDIMWLFPVGISDRQIEREEAENARRIWRNGCWRNWSDSRRNDRVGMQESSWSLCGVHCQQR